MQFKLTIDEVIFIRETFRFPRLLCVENKKHNPKVAKDLIEKNIIEDKGTYFELKPEYRMLFKHWSQMEMTMFRPLEVNKKRLDCIMANEKSVLVYRQKKDDVVLDYFDFEKHAVDSLIAGFAKISPRVQCENNFVISLCMSEAQDFLHSADTESLTVWQNKTGISVDLLHFCLTSLAQENNNVILIENHHKEIGCLVQIINTERGIVALKHITPLEEKNERMVLVFGDSHYVVDSLYNV